MLQADSLVFFDQLNRLIRQSFSKGLVAINRIVQVVLNRFAFAVHPVVQVVSVDPCSSRVVFCDFDLDVSHHCPVCVSLVLHVKVTQATDDHVDVLTLQVLSAVVSKSPFRLAS